MEKNMAEEKFLIENYGKKGTFASFLPGISGEKGIPIWCYYVNRGQCVVSFGVDNKDHSIMEFYPAHQAYQNVKTTGFRTFVKKDGKVTELFADENQTHRMEIAMNGLKIEEEKRKKYNPDKIFKSDEKKEKIESKVAMTVYKESVFRKFINKIKNIFHVS